MNVADELAKLKKLLDEGVLSEEEFEAQKSKLLNGSTEPFEPNLNGKPRKKKKVSGCLVAFAVVAVVCAAVIPQIINQAKEEIDQTEVYNDNQTEQSENTNIFFDANMFISVDNRPFNETELIDLLGEPLEIEEWNFKTETKSFPIRTLYYEINDESITGYTYSYNFNNDLLRRVSIDGVKIPYSNKKNILGMFGLREYSNSTIADTGVAYRVMNCGVHDLWAIMTDEGYLDSIKISYSDIFG